MKKVQVEMYECDYCGTKYATEYQCDACEKRHEKELYEVSVTLVLDFVGEGHDRIIDNTKLLTDPTKEQKELARSGERKSKLFCVNPGEAGEAVQCGRKWWKIAKGAQGRRYAESELWAHAQHWIDTLDDSHMRKVHTRE